MSSASLPQQRPRGHANKLHKAAYGGSIERLMAVLSDGSIDINHLDEEGWTPLMIASSCGDWHVVRILLKKGADVSICGAGGRTALHVSATRGHLAVTKRLVSAGANVDAAMNEGNSDGATALHLAAEKGHLGIMSVLIGAGANLDSRSWDGMTPLFLAAQGGRLDAVKLLLRAKANPRLARTDADDEWGRRFVPLDMAAQCGHWEIVRELVQQLGIEGCGGPTAGVLAFRLAALDQHLDIMAMLADAGVEVTGGGLITAAARSSAQSMKFMLQQRKDDEAAFANFQNHVGETPLLCAIGSGDVPISSPGIVRLLVDAGADTTSAIEFLTAEGEVEFNDTPLAIVSLMLDEKKVHGKDATEEELHRLEGIRRLLLRVGAIHAVSFLWPVVIPSIVGAAAEDTSKTVASSSPLRMMLPILRRRARRPRVLLTALFRLVLHIATL